MTETDPVIQVGDVVKLQRVNDFFDCAAQRQADDEFAVRNGGLWVVVKRSTGWWTDVQPWIIKSLKSDHEIERFDSDLTKVEEKL